MAHDLCVNPGKKEYFIIQGETYACYAVKTHTVTAEDKVWKIIETYALPHLQKGDILIISEKMVACTQGRAIPIDTINPRPLARFLCRYVYRNPYGIGLSIPETMECAIRECGTMRILIAAGFAALGKLLGIRGVFYRIAGKQAFGIDGPCEYTLPPYNRYVVLSPYMPDKVVKRLSKRFNDITILIVDANDADAKILASSDNSFKRKTILQLLKENPLGQSTESTPLGIIRHIALSDSFDTTQTY